MENRATVDITAKYEALTAHLRTLQFHLQSRGIEAPEVDRAVATLAYYERQNATVLCGVAGAGKSTLLNILLGYSYLPTTKPDEPGLSVTPIAIEVRKTRSIGDRIKLEVHLIDDVSWKIKRGRNISPVEEKSEEVTEASQNFLSAVFAQQSVFDFNNTFDWSNNLANLKEEQFDDPISDFLRSTRVVTEWDTVPSVVSDKLQSYIDDRLAPLIVQKIVLIGAFTNGHLPEETIIFDLPGSGDINDEKEDQRRKMLVKARRAIVVVPHNTRFKSVKDAVTMTNELSNTYVDNTVSLQDQSLIVFNRAWSRKKGQTLESAWQEYQQKISGTQQSILANCAFLDDNEVDHTEFNKFFDTQLAVIKSFIAQINLEKEKAFTQILDQLRIAAWRLGSQKAPSLPDIPEQFKQFHVGLSKLKHALVEQVSCAPANASLFKETFDKIVRCFSHNWKSSDAFARYRGVYGGRSGSADVPQDFADLLLASQQIDFGLLNEHLSKVWQTNATKQFNQSLNKAIRNAIHSVILNNYSGFLYGPYYGTSNYINVFMERFWRDWPTIKELVIAAIKFQLSEFNTLVEQRVLLLTTIHQNSQLTVDQMKSEVSATLPLPNHQAIRWIMKSVYQLYNIWIQYHPGYQFADLTAVKPTQLWEKEDNVEYLKPTFTSFLLFGQALPWLPRFSTPTVIVIRYLGLSKEHVEVLKRWLDPQLKQSRKLEITVDVTGNDIDQESLNELNSKYSALKVEFVDSIKYTASSLVPDAPSCRIGIVIGNANYNAPIASCAKNQQSVRQFLQGLKFTILETNEIKTRNEWNSLILQLEDQLKEQTSRALIVFYYSGHGCIVEGKHCIVSTSNDIIPLTKLYHICQTKDTTNIFIMDCCQAGFSSDQVDAAIVKEAKDKSFPARLLRSFASCPLNYAYAPLANVNTVYTQINLKHLERAHATRQSVVEALRAAADEYDQLTDVQKGQPYISVSGAFPFFSL